MSTIKNELDEIMGFEDCKIIRAKQEGCEIHIAVYTIGGEDCVTLFEDYDGDKNFTRVNVNNYGLIELYKVLKEIIEK